MSAPKVLGANALAPGFIQQMQGGDCMAWRVGVRLHDLDPQRARITELRVAAYDSHDLSRQLLKLLGAKRYQACRLVWAVEVPATTQLAQRFATELHQMMVRS